MQIDINELIELVKSVKPMFLNHTEAEHVTVKGRADFVTQVDIRVQEYTEDFCVSRDDTFLISRSLAAEQTFGRSRYDTYFYKIGRASCRERV